LLFLVFRDQDSGTRIQGPGFREQDSGSRIQGAGFRDQDSGTRFQETQSNVTDFVRPWKTLEVPFTRWTLSGLPGFDVFDE
jgi:hypothetical protein